MWCHQFGSSVRLSPSSRMVTQRTLTDIDPFLWRLARSSFSRGLLTEGLLRTFATGWTTARGVSDGAQMLVYMGSSMRSGSARTRIHFALSLTFGRLSTRHGLKQPSFACISLASLVECGAPLPTFSVGRSPRCEFEETSRLHGWTLGSHRGACFHPCSSISW